MIDSWRRVPVSFGLLVLLLTGCVGPDFERPPAPEAEGYTARPLPAATQASEGRNAAAQRFVQGGDIPAQWWRLFRSEPLNALIDHALTANPNVQAGQAALRAAREATEAERGSFLPTLTAGFSSNRTKNAGSSTSANATASSPVANLHTAQLSLGYTPDVWGATWRQVEGQEAQEEAQRFQIEATQLTLASTVVVAAVNEAMLRGQIQAQHDIVTAEREALSIQKKMLELGQIAGGDVAAQEAALAQAEAALPPLEKQLAIQRDALSALLGRLPSQELEDVFSLDTLHLPEDLPLSLPAQLVEQRPDIRQAEANLHTASAAIGVAIAARLPLVNLTADMGSVASLVAGKDKGYSTSKVGLFTPGTGFWTIAGSVSQTLFDGFTLMHRQHAAEALFEQADAEYRSTVITAFQNVADTLHALRSDAEALKAAVAAENAADRSFSITRRQLELGAINHLALLNAQQTLLQARTTRIQAEANRLTDTAALFQALGGGWWNRDVPHASAVTTSEPPGAR